ncbi:hypothetical protein CRG98_049251 [Punica granatum]|uniref:Uncharacterized protein n=1 Tax=Punica granatum TaxID=22663 RepID=A0A2I0HF89_PUNGR|nr:hypothetical protein CRG98_049251 [Punica granatum]
MGLDRPLARTQELRKMTALLNIPGVGPRIQVEEDESGKLPNVLVARLQETRVVVAHA